MEDNAGCVALAHGQKDTAKSNHFKRTQAYVEGLASRGILWLDDVPGKYNPADLFTKSVEPAHHFCTLRDVLMGVVPELHMSRGFQDLLNNRDDPNANALLRATRDWQAGRLTPAKRILFR